MNSETPHGVSLFLCAGQAAAARLEWMVLLSATAKQVTDIISQILVASEEQSFGIEQVIQAVLSMV